MTELDVPPAQSLDAENPWPGLMPFTEATQAFFHGRDEEAIELLRRVRRELLTILFGQSGLGKTSLLSAGLFPRLRAADFLPVYLRLDLGTPQLTPVDQIKAALAEDLAAHAVEARPPRHDETLWAYFHDKETEFWSRRNRLITPVLVFDQFEEIFTLGRGISSVDALVDELAALVEDRPPATVRSALEDDPEAARRYDFAKQSCKLIFALREDFLPELEGLQRRMPSIMENRMRLRRMDGRQARDAILASGAHLVAPGVAEKVIAFVAASRGRSGKEADSHAELETLEIEPALLSIVCRELNNKRIRVGQSQITADLLEGAQQEIVAAFYESSLAGLDPAAKLYIEEQLLTSEGYRDSRPLADALRQPGVTRADIDTLVSRRLLRIEERFGTQWVELTHDVLTGVIRQQRDLRREQTRAAQEAEARAQAERERAQRAEAEALRERAEREVQTALAREATARERLAQRLVRRTRLWLAAVVATLLVAIGLGWQAYYEQGVAEARAKEATASYETALKAAKDVVDFVERQQKSGQVVTKAARTLLDIAQKTFGALPETREEVATTRARIKLFDKFASTYQAFGNLAAARQAAETELDLAKSLASGRAEDQLEVADSQRTLGDILLVQGNFADALQNFQGSLQIAVGLAAKDPENADWQREIADSRNRLGLLQQNRGDLGAALKELHAGLDITKQLVSKNPSNDDWQRELADSYYHVGEVVESQGKLPEAFREFEAELEIRAQLATEDPESTDRQVELLRSHSRVGRVLQSQGYLSEAAKEYQTMLEIITPLAVSDPTNNRWQQQLASAHEYFGYIIQKQEDSAKAFQEYKSGLAIRKQLVAKDSDNTDWQADLMRSRNLIGQLLQDQGELTRAFDEFQASLAIIIQLTATDPSNADWQRELGETHNRIGNLLRAQGDLVSALAEYDAGLAIMTQLATKDPTNMRWQEDVETGHTLLAEALGAQGELADALEHLKDARDIIAQLAENDPDNDHWRNNSVIVHSRISAVLSSKGDYDRALEEARIALATITPLVATDPHFALNQQSLAGLHWRICDASLGRGDLGTALEECRIAVEIDDELVTRTPADPAWQGDLGRSHGKLGRVLVALKDLTGAREEFTVAMSKIVQLATQNPRKVEWQQELVELHKGEGDAERDLSSYARAREEYKACVETAEPILSRGSMNKELAQAAAYCQAQLAALDKRVQDASK
jgi:tetratricopeptide (TPR) repeat protein